MARTKSRGRAKRRKLKNAEGNAGEKGKKEEENRAAVSTGKCYEDGRTFVIPETYDTIQLLLRITELPTILAWALILTTLYVFARTTERGTQMLCPPGTVAMDPVYVLYVALFWRVCYNVVLGATLHWQSKTRFITKYVESLRRQRSPSFSRKIISRILHDAIDGHEDPLQELPAPFCAWILHTSFVNIILPNDVIAFSLTAFSYGIRNGFDIFVEVERNGLHLSNIPETLKITVRIITYIVGVLLCYFSLWSKRNAHSVIGKYCWFWGDFFFQQQLELRFDGVFELFPHPMYTAGYGWMYGVSIMVGTPAIACLSIVSHALQIGFLEFVEQPHIDKTYGAEILAEEGLRGTKQSNINIFRNFNTFRANDWSLVIIQILLAAVFALLAFLSRMETQEPLVQPYMYVFLALGSRLLGSMIIGAVLKLQERNNYWSRQYSSATDAFREWTRFQVSLLPPFLLLPRTFELI